MLILKCFGKQVWRARALFEKEIWNVSIAHRALYKGAHGHDKASGQVAASGGRQAEALAIERRLQAASNHQLALEIVVVMMLQKHVTAEREEEEKAGHEIHVGALTAERRP